MNSAPMCSAFTDCASFGRVLISAASTTVCAEAACTAGECCAVGLLFALFSAHFLVCLLLTVYSRAVLLLRFFLFSSFQLCFCVFR